MLNENQYNMLNSDFFYTKLVYLHLLVVEKLVFLINAVTFVPIITHLLIHTYKIQFDLIN